MKINVFRTQCKEGARVFFDGDITCTGTVRKISKDGSRALVCFDNGDVSWKEYFMIDLLRTSHGEQEKKYSDPSGSYRGSG